MPVFGVQGDPRLAYQGGGRKSLGGPDSSRRRGGGGEGLLGAAASIGDRWRKDSGGSGGRTRGDASSGASRSTRLPPRIDANGTATKRKMTFPYQDQKYRIYSLPPGGKDPSQRCKLTGICDGDHSCGPDGLGCVTAAKERQDRVREAARWSWAGYRRDTSCSVTSVCHHAGMDMGLNPDVQPFEIAERSEWRILPLHACVHTRSCFHPLPSVSCTLRSACRKFAWGHDEVNPSAQTPRDWFRLGLTIVDSIDTLLILKLDEEYAEARQWVANHLDMEVGSVSVRRAKPS